MTAHSSHWHGSRSVPGPVDPDGCCADKTTAPTRASILADLNTERETRDTMRLAELIARWTLLTTAALAWPALMVIGAVNAR